MGSLVEFRREEEVGPEQVIDALQGYVDQRKVTKLICVGEDEEGNLSIIMTDMTNTEVIGTMNVALYNYIHQFQHD